MIKLKKNRFILAVAILSFSFTIESDKYPWVEKYDINNTIASRIKVPEGYKRIEVDNGSFGEWLRHLPLKPENTPVKLWNGQLKSSQNVHYAVVDLDLIGKNLQQCIDAIIRLRSEYLYSHNREEEILFSYTCCNEKISWKKWKDGWRTKIVRKNGVDSFKWIKTTKYDNSYENFRKYLFNIMMYAGTLSLSKDMKKISFSDVTIGDVYIQGGLPGAGHGVLILDMAVSSTGKKIMLLGQSYMPAQDFHILRNPNSPLSPWFEVDFSNWLITPEWTFSKEHARRF